MHLRSGYEAKLSRKWLGTLEEAGYILYSSTGSVQTPAFLQVTWKILDKNPIND